MTDSNQFILDLICRNHSFSGEGFRDKPIPLHCDVSILHNSPDFVDDDLDLDQQPAVTSPRGDVTFDSVVGEAGEGERAVRFHIIT